MTDSHTLELFGSGTDSDVVFPVSRLLVDVERFEDDAQESMVSRGMGVLYCRTHDRKSLRREISSEEREELLAKYYRPHHMLLQEKVDEALDEDGLALIVDCHSFPLNRLPYEIGGEGSRPEICIGTDSFHTPKKLRDLAVESFEQAGFSVDVDQPFAGALTPLKHYAKDQRVMALMIEVRRDLYMDEETGEKSDGFNDVRAIVQQTIDKLGAVAPVSHQSPTPDFDQFFRWRKLEKDDLALNFTVHDMPITAFRNYRTAEELIGQWIFEVGVVSWDGHAPYMAWKPFRYWKTPPDDARIARAKAAALRTPRFFRVCSMCQVIKNMGHMCDKTTCQGCAEKYLGVVF